MYFSKGLPLRGVTLAFIVVHSVELTMQHEIAGKNEFLTQRRKQYALLVMRVYIHPAIRQAHMHTRIVVLSACLIAS